MHTETQIRTAIRPLVEKYGPMTTSQVKQYIEEIIEFDNEDLEQSDSRKNEVKIIQRIGNIVSHQNELEKQYPEGFILDKKGDNAIFYPISGFKSLSTIQPIVAEKKSKSCIIRKDWQKENQKKTQLGLLGEQYVLGIEKDNVRSFSNGSDDDISRVIHASIMFGDGLGYDILSLNDKGETIFIEVKTTSLDENTPFYMSRNEYDFFKENEDQSFIYRLYNFDITKLTANYIIISANSLFKDYEFNPSTYIVTKK